MKISILLTTLVTFMLLGPVFNKTGDKLPNSTLTNILTGKTVDIEKRVRSSKKPTLIVLWSRSCHVCLNEIEKLKTYKLPLITITYTTNIESMKSFLEDRMIGYTVLAGDDKVFAKYGAIVVPYWLLVDSNMKILKQGGGEI